jgi:SAM-dependent methyltransferase
MPTIDVVSPIDFHDINQARDWVSNTVATKPWRPQFFAAFEAALHDDFSRPVKILEMGSGPGHLAEHILRNCSVESYTALDFSAAMHLIAKEQLGELASKAIFVQRDFRRPDWTVGLGSFDAVVTMQAAHEVRHRDHLPSLLQQAQSLIRPGGIFLFCDHYSEVGSKKNPELYVTKEAQPQLLRDAGFTNITRLLDEGGMALFRAIKPSSRPKH